MYNDYLWIFKNHYENKNELNVVEPNTQIDSVHSIDVYWAIFFVCTPFGWGAVEYFL